MVTSVSEPTSTPLSWSPQVVYTSPAPGEELPLDGTITIRFDQPTDKLSVGSAFHFAQVGSEDDQLEGTFTWPRPDTVMFTPTKVIPIDVKSAALNRQSSYQVQLSSQALGENKLPLRESLSLDVRPVGHLAVAQVIPVNNSKVGADTAVTVIFIRAVVPLTPTDQQANRDPACNLHKISRIGVNSAFSFIFPASAKSHVRGLRCCAEC
ncbi:MAG: Ig-like domain-containing protein [Chloroflexota bacterium]